MPDVVWRRTGEGAVLRRVGQDQYVVLDVAGTALWEALERPGTTARLADLLGMEFAAEPAALVPDVERALDDLLTRGLVRREVG